MVKQMPEQLDIVLIGSKSGTTRTAEALETTYDESTQFAFETGGFNKISIACLYTTGSGETDNSVEIQLEQSPDGTNFYQLANEAASGGTSTLTQREFTFTGASAATAYAFDIILDINYRNMRIEAKETGVVSNAGTFYAEATLGVV